MTKVIEALNEFRITDKPQDASFKRAGKFDALIVAVKNLANERSIELTPSEFKERFGDYGNF